MNNGFSFSSPISKKQVPRQVAGWVYPPYEQPWKTPKVRDFTTTRSGNSSAGVVEDMSNGLGICLRSTSPGSDSNSNTYIDRPLAVGGAGWRMTARIRVIAARSQYGMYGLSMRDSVSGKITTFALGTFGGTGAHREDFSGSDTYSAHTDLLAYIYQNDVWLRLWDDLTNWNYQYSMDGLYWSSPYVTTRNPYLATNPTNVGLAINPNYAGNFSGKLAAMVVYHFLLEPL